MFYHGTAIIFTADYHLPRGKNHLQRGKTIYHFFYPVANGNYNFDLQLPGQFESLNGRFIGRVNGVNAE